MSIANFERIRKSLDFLQEALANFVEREIRKEGISKEEMLKLLANPSPIQRRLADKPIDMWDVSALIEVILKTWREIFYKNHTSQIRAYILESRGIRNQYSHPTPKREEFDDDYTYRSLDTIWRLLEAISAPQSKEIEIFKKEVERSMYDVPSPNNPSEKSDGKTEYIIGIDLGTTNSCVAIMDEDECRVLDDLEGGGGPIIPSVVKFPEEGEVLVGHFAKTNKIYFPKITIDSIKRLIGRRFYDEEVQCYIKDASYSIVRTDNGDASTEIHGECKLPQEVSAHILHKMKRIAAQHLGEINAAVITVPARFNNSQRQATKDAGRIAGLDVKRIINEPTAAALNYVKDNWREGLKIAIYDFGGGTFDVSIIEMVKIDDRRRIEVKSTNGDATLGGVKFDARIAEYVYDYINKEHGLDLRKNKDPKALIITKAEIDYQAEEAKKHLSNEKQTFMNIKPPAIGSEVITVNLSRSRLESLVDDLIARTVEPCRMAMKDAGVSASDIDKVILVGGQTRMPKVQELVKSIFGKEPSWGVDPDKSVALGAAILGGMLADGGGSTDFEDVTYQDVTSYSLGIKQKNGKMKKLIDKGTIIPISKSHIFTTSEDYQSAVTVCVFQGESEIACDNELLEYFHLKGIERAPRGVPKIEVSINIDSNDCWNVSAIDKATGTKRSIRITRQTGLFDEEIEQLAKKVKLSTEDGRKPHESTDGKSDIDSEVHEAKKVLGEFGNQVGESEKTLNEYEDEASLTNATEESAKNLTDPKNKDEAGWTPLHKAAWDGHYESVKRLINAGLDPNVTNNHGHTPLHLAAFSGHLPVVRELVNVGFDLNAKDEEGKTPLHNAGGRGHFDVIKALVEAGANINATMLNGKKPSDIAAEQGHDEIFAKAVAAALNAKDEEGKTPLHNAAGRGHFDVIKALVKAGANENATMLNGKKPSDIAAEQGHGEIFAEAVAAAKRAD